MGGIENLKLSLAYYSQALKLNPSSMRSLFGLFLCASSLSTNPRVPPGDKKEYSRVVSWAADQITKRYADTNVLEDSKTDMLAGVFGALQIQG